MVRSTGGGQQRSLAIDLVSGLDGDKKIKRSGLGTLMCSQQGEERVQRGTAYGTRQGWRH